MTERVKLHAEMASLLIEKVREFVPVLKLKNAREAKQLVGEVRELSKAIAQDQASAGEELPPGVKRVVTLEDMQARKGIRRTERAIPNDADHRQTDTGA